jgi:hypothetical protein
MSERAFDLTEARFDFSNDSLVKDSLLERLLSRQKNAESSRVQVSLDSVMGVEDRGITQASDSALGRERDLPSPDKGRGL